MSEKSSSSRRLIFTAEKLGFCNGVRRALDAVEDILRSNKSDTPLYIYNEIVHNTFVVNSLKQRGVNFTTDLDKVPDHATVIWSAHGVPPELEARARARNIMVKDATCPLVKHLHDLAAEHSRRGDIVIFIGHKNHPETIGVLGCGDIFCVGNADDCKNLPEFAPEKNIVVLTQTTWCSRDTEELLEILRRRFPQLAVAGGICYATSERQQAVRKLIEEHAIELLIVIGSPKSSNSNRLCEVARQMQVPAVLVDDPTELQETDLSSISSVGVTAGASAPEILLEQALDILQKKHQFKLYKDC